MTRDSSNRRGFACIVAALFASTSLAAIDASAQAPIACLKEGPLSAPETGAFALAFPPDGSAPSAGMVKARWASTATDGSTGTSGDPITITWGIVPDGTPIDGYYNSQGEPDDEPSNLVATLDSIYGSSAVWMPLIQDAFDGWSEVAGITFVHEPADDGQTVPTFGSTGAGQLGARPDVRLSGHRIDGNYAIVAYARQPNFGGDIVIDTNDAFFGDLSLGSLNLRNTLAHELGHAMGLEHVCPGSGMGSKKKLMEPIIVQDFDGPQHDDLLAMNENYGDVREPDDSIETALTLGFGIGGSLAQTNLSVAGVSDEDWIEIPSEVGLAVNVSLQPYGETYLYADSVGGACTGVVPSQIDTFIHQDLAVQVLAADGVTEVAFVDAAGLGGDETISELSVPGGGFLRIVGDGGSEPQVYDLFVQLVPEPGPGLSSASGLLTLAVLARRRGRYGSHRSDRA